MSRFLLAAALIATSTLALPASAPAQNAAQNGTLVIFGNDRCPTNADGDEIVVCVRRPEGERFRIPQELREAAPDRENESWAARAQTVLGANDNGIGSCSTVGPGGQSGCFVRNATAGRAETRARRDAETALP
jgi:hypothetical protein